MDSEAFGKLENGDEQELRSLYRRYLSAFVRYICREFKCSLSRAEELYPEAFSILFYNIKEAKLKEPLKSTLQTYLNSTGWNLYHRRYLDKFNRDKIQLDPVELQLVAKNMVDEALIQQERATHLRALLEKLGEPCQSLLYKVYYDEISYNELSAQMALPETTLRKRKFDCLGKLRKLFDEYKLDL